jgi:hypothetical protein
VLGIFWLWNGIAYHLAFFTSINSAAYAFGALFAAQGLLFLGYGAAADNVSLRAPADLLGFIAIGLIIYSGIVYPVASMALRHGWPRAPMFGVAPCPTAIFTFGLLMLSARPLPIWLLGIPWRGLALVRPLPFCWESRRISRCSFLACWRRRCCHPGAGAEPLLRPSAWW